MPTSLSSIPFLGSGLGFRSVHSTDVFIYREKIDFLEITADHYLHATKRKKEELRLLHENFTLIPHAINLSLGSADGLQPEYLDALAELIAYINPPYWSEHIAFTQFGGVEIGHLAPVIFSEEMLDVLCENIQTAQKYIHKPLILENITYLFKVTMGDINETDFITALLNRTSCGLLLDITNLYSNAFNHHFDYKDFLAAIPLEKVIQLHYVGGYIDANGILIDSHSHSTPPEIWKVMQDVISQTPHLKGIVLERDERIPPLKELLPEIQKTKTFLRDYSKTY